MVLSGAPVTKKKRAVTPCVAPSTLPLPRGGGGEHGQVESGAAGEFQRHDFVSNVVKTTKYNVLTFLPKNLFEQFSKAANMYFLVILILQYIEIIAPWAPTMVWLRNLVAGLLYNSNDRRTCLSPSLCPPWPSRRRWRTTFASWLTAT